MNTAQENALLKGTLREMLRVLEVSKTKDGTKQDAIELSLIGHGQARELSHWRTALMQARTLSGATP